MFEKGSKVEVMNKQTELPTSWCVAEVISGNRHTYKLRYDCYPPSVEKVSKEFIRPCPRSKYLQSWVAGDIVEVYDDECNSWKTATVCNISDGGHFVIRLLGSSAQDLNVHQSNIRTRQSWKDGQWVPVVKISGGKGDVNVNKQMVVPNFHTKLGLEIPIPDAQIDQENDSNLLVYPDAGVHESRRVVSFKSLKKASPFYSSHLQASPENYKKLKPSEKERIDSFTFTEDNKQIQASFHNTVHGFYEKQQRISKPNESDNEDCSIGSCGNSNDGTNKWSSPNGPISSDAKSLNTTRDEGRNDCPSPGQKAAENIHRLELNAYRSTLDALYASGPLSWDKEALLTNLRINLHISNDEHLTELKNLISVGVGILNY